MLNEFQRKWGSQVVISYTDYTDTREVDAKLIRITKELGGKLLTNDFNLHKVAGLQGVPVLNINNLINSLKPIVLPGEEMDIQVVKEGKDENQGIGYLDDGTMVVVENGRHLLNKKVRVVVTSMIQTNAGKMIFTKPEKHLARKLLALMQEAASLILLLGGSGSRFGSDKPKQFHLFQGSWSDSATGLLFETTTSVLLNAVPIDQVLFVLPSSLNTKLTHIFKKVCAGFLRKYPKVDFIYTEGGQNRHSSFEEGVMFLKKKSLQRAWFWFMMRTVPF